MQNPEQLPLRQEVLDLSGNETIRQATVLVLRDLINDPAQKDLWERFRYTFEARRQMPWLPESGTPDQLEKYFHVSPEDPRYEGEFVPGIFGGLASAIHRIGYDNAQWLTEENERRSMRLPVDEDFTGQLLNAVNIIEDMPAEELGWTVYPIKHYALRASDPITMQTFKTDIVKGLHFCWEQTYSQGYSGDPW